MSYEFNSQLLIFTSYFQLFTSYFLLFTLIKHSYRLSVISDAITV